MAKQVETDFEVLILNSRISDLFLLLSIAVFPFVNLITTRVLSGFSPGGVSLLNAIFMVALLLICLVRLLDSKHERGALLLYVFAAMLFAVLIKMLLQGGTIGLIRWLSQYHYYFFVPLFAFALINSEIPIAVFGRLSIYVSIIVCLLSIYSFFSNNYFGLVSQSVGAEYLIVGTSFMRMMGLFGSPNVAASYYLVMLVICSYETRLKRGVLLSARLLLLICLILTFSRAAAIALLLFYGVRLAFDGGAGRFRARKLLLPLMLGLLFVVIPIAVDHGIYFWSFNEDFFNNPRLSKWASGLSIVSDNLLLGIEFSAIATAGTWETTLSDNSFLLCASGFGLFGCAIFYGGLFRALFHGCWHNMQRLTLLAVTIILLFFYDFINFYPVNYILIVAVLLAGDSFGCAKDYADETIGGSIVVSGNERAEDGQ